MEMDLDVVQNWHGEWQVYLSIGGKQFFQTGGPYENPGTPKAWAEKNLGVLATDWKEVTSMGSGKTYCTTTIKLNK